MGPGRPSDGSNDLQSFCRSFGHAFFYVVMQYWVASLLLSSQIWLTDRKLREIADSSPEVTGTLGLPVFSTFLNPHTYASAITANCHHFFAPDAGLWGVQHATLPMDAAFHYFALWATWTRPKGMS